MSRATGDRAPLIYLARPTDVLRGGGEHLRAPSERHRAGSLRRGHDRDAYIAAHLLVRHCAAALTGRPVEALTLVQQCAECGSTDHGRPSIEELPDVHVSLAHTSGAAVAGADRQPIGVDVERAPANGLDPAVLGLALTPAERSRVLGAADPSAAFLRHWVRKECLVKVGAITLDELSRVDVGPASADAAAGRGTRDRFGALHLTDWFDAALGVVVAAATARPPAIGTPGSRAPNGTRRSGDRRPHSCSSRVESANG